MALLLALVVVPLWFCMPLLAADSAPAGTLIRNQASATYKDTDGVLQSTQSNVVEIGIRAVPGLELLTDQKRLATPGTTIFFSHRLTNTGNGPDSYQLQSLNTQTGDNGDFSFLHIFEDHDGDGIADDGADGKELITRSPELLAGESWHFVVEARLPDDLVVSDVVILSLDATSVLSIAIGAVMKAKNTDHAIVADGAIIVEKKQAPDVGCDAVPDTPYSEAKFSIAPGANCVLYRLTAKNTGNIDSYNVILSDQTPNYTSFHAIINCSDSLCVVAAPAAGNTGAIRATLPSLAPRESLILEFSVRVE